MSTPRICPSCNNYLFDDEAPKCVCANNCAPEPERSSEGAVTCSDLICEWEAALSTAEKMMKETERKEGSTYYYWQGRYDEAESALDRARRHSQIGEHSNTPTPHQ
jgi:hypothetical protein